MLLASTYETTEAEAASGNNLSAAARYSGPMIASTIFSPSMRP